MCGDLDEEDGSEAALYARFRTHAGAFINTQAGAAAGSGDLSAYLDRLFANLLTKCVQDSDALETGHRYEAMAAQPLVLARLAGLLAGHASLRDDPLRKAIEALMLGYSEAQTAQAHDHPHDDMHLHGHHDHSH